MVVDFVTSRVDILNSLLFNHSFTTAVRTKSTAHISPTFCRIQPVYYEHNASEKWRIGLQSLSNDNVVCSLLDRTYVKCVCDLKAL